MTLRRASLLVSATLVLLAALGAPRLATLARERRVSSIPRPLDVVLLTLDTTRADRLGCYGDRHAATPNLDRLAARGVRFLNAYSHVPLTCPAHASILTGLIPARHGVHDNGSFVLGDGPTTLAEALVDAGYRTGAFVSAFVLDRRFGLARGFAAYEDEVPGGSGENTEASVRASVTVDRALEWLRRDSGRPTFLWVHLYDPHHPYEPPEPFASRYTSRPYDGEVAYMDAELGRLLEAVAERRRPTLVAAMGDHGESLGEHQELTHSYFIYSATQRVPLILSLPGHLPEGRTVAPVVRGVDLMPTLLELAGVPAPQGIDGRSLVPLVTGRRADEPGPAYLESYHPRLWWGAGELLGLRTGHWLFIRSKRPELYRTDANGGETADVASQHPAEVESLGARLASMLGDADPLAGRQPLDAEAEARLKALGYVVASAAPDAGPGELPDAKDNGPLLAGHTRANQLLAAGRKEEALQAFRDTLRLNPRSASVRMAIASLLVDLGRPAEALPLLSQVSGEDPRNESAVLGTARCLAALGRRDDALRALREAATRMPRSARLHEELGKAHLEDRRLEPAAQELRLAVDLDPRTVGARLRLGLVLLRLERLRDASSELQVVVTRSPRSEEARQAQPALLALGARFLDAGAFDESCRAYEAALASGARSEAAYLNLSLAAYRSGRRPRALEVLSAGATDHPGSAEIRYRTGRLLQESGRPLEAEAEYRKALELDPGRGDAAKALESLQARSGSGAP
jgi:arylsulfatase A-like enzyme/tetratricopeptide (TPR) repeat protein